MTIKASLEDSDANFWYNISYESSNKIAQRQMREKVIDRITIAEFDQALRLKITGILNRWIKSTDIDKEQPLRELRYLLRLKAQDSISTNWTWHIGRDKVYATARDLAKAAIDTPASEKEHFEVLKKCIVQNELNPNLILISQVGRIGSHPFNASLLGFMCWHGKTEMVDWLLQGEGFACPTNPNDIIPDENINESTPPAILLAAFSTAIPVDRKIAILRLFPLAVNPLLKQVNGTWFLAQLNPSLIESSVLQCLMERAMVAFPQEAYRIKINMGHGERISLLDEYIEVFKKSHWVRTSKAEAEDKKRIAKILMAHRIFVLSEANRKWINRKPELLAFETVRKTACVVHEEKEEASKDVTPEKIDIAIGSKLGERLKKIVINYYGNQQIRTLFNSRFCFSEVSGKLAEPWMDEELWDNDLDDATTILAADSVMLARRNHARRLRIHHCVKVLEIFNNERLIGTEPADLQRMHQNLKEMAGVLGTLVHGHASTAATAHAASSSSASMVGIENAAENFQRQIDAMSNFYVEELEKFRNRPRASEIVVAAAAAAPAAERVRTRITHHEYAERVTNLHREYLENRRKLENSSSTECSEQVRNLTKEFSQNVDRLEHLLLWGI